MEKNLTDKVVDAIFAVHRAMGPGLPESIYEECLTREFDLNGIAYEQQVKVNVQYKGQTLTKYFRLDLLVENKVIVEIKSVSELLPLHEAQLLAYLKVADKRIGYVVNFNVHLVKDGIRRIVNGYTFNNQ